MHSGRVDCCLNLHMMTEFQTLQTIAAGFQLCDCIVIQSSSISAYVCVCVCQDREKTNATHSVIPQKQ